MPELPEVETIRRSLRQHLISRKISDTQIRNPSLRWPVSAELPDKLKNQIIVDVLRRGKVVSLKLSDGYLLIHPGMTGKLLLRELTYTPEKHDHLVITLNDCLLVYNDARRFGYAEWAVDMGKTSERFRLKGPAPYEPDFTFDYMKMKLNRSRTAIKATLMNDKVLLGLGNIYASELLFRAGIHPEEISCRLSDTKINDIFTNIKPLLDEAIAMGGSTLRDYVDARDQKGNFQKAHQVYNRDGLPCNNCQSVVVKTSIAGRSTFYCPACQPSFID